jgi:hypothetical protein
MGVQEDSSRGATTSYTFDARRHQDKTMAVFFSCQSPATAMNQNTKFKWFGWAILTPHPVGVEKKILLKSSIVEEDSSQPPASWQLASSC